MKSRARIAPPMRIFRSSDARSPLTLMVLAPPGAAVPTRSSAVDRYRASALPLTIASAGHGTPSAQGVWRIGGGRGGKVATEPVCRASRHAARRRPDGRVLLLPLHAVVLVRHDLDTAVQSHTTEDGARLPHSMVRQASRGAPLRAAPGAIRGTRRIILISAARGTGRRRRNRGEPFGLAGT